MTKYNILKKRYYRFGSLAQIDLAGEGKWFSCDNHGMVRVHRWGSAGWAA